MRVEHAGHDITVVGGGLAGVCAAIAAARLGRTVALINNRPVLGGNSSSEVRVWVVGATSHGDNHYAREGGIMGELFVENQYRNPQGNPYVWDTVVLDAVRAEPNISLYLNTDVRDVDADGPPEARRIHTVTGWMMGSERLIHFSSPIFLDCTGDGLIGHLAGSEYRIGRESRGEYGEPWAPAEADDITLGSTLLFYTKDAGEPVTYVAPSFAKDITRTSIPQQRLIRAGDNGTAYWWIEYGGELDTVHDNDVIRDELWSVIYGIWDHIKNSGRFDADTMTLEWVGAVPGKREYRRFIGDYVLTQNDIMGQTEFPDRIAFGGWSIDMHPPQGMYATEAASKHLHPDGVYHIPYRCLYSVNTTNLLFAGRNISASHIAFGSTRVMATCATLGQVAGTAAVLCLDRQVAPRELDVGQLQQTLLRSDASLIGLAAADPADQARAAQVTASSTLDGIEVTEPGEPWPLTADAGIVLPVDPVLTGLELLADAAETTTLVVELHDPGLGQNYVPGTLIDTAEVPVVAGARQWVRLPLEWTPPTARNAFLRLRANRAVTLHVADTAVPGVLSLTHVPPATDLTERQPVLEWKSAALRRRTFCLRTGPTAAYSADKVVDGYLRPFAGPHLWTSRPLATDGEPWLQLAWAEPVTVSRIEIIANDDVNEDLINLPHHRMPFTLMPTLVRDYRIEARAAGAGWRPLVSVAGNRQRRRTHGFAAPIVTDRIRVVVTATNGTGSAQLIAVRAYA
ncbi:FAD-dependent oxidoreductase [Sphaerisporangium sp. NPDC005289]|uniref:FAD-dependent oxidoreductase n=1 Tax=Sphaerisporangium sp. NPDC005289 TaxID=3155247 RepID=UPI0033B66357